MSINPKRSRTDSSEEDVSEIVQNERLALIFLNNEGSFDAFTHERDRRVSKVIRDRIIEFASQCENFRGDKEEVNATLALIALIEEKINNGMGRSLMLPKEHVDWWKANLADADFEGWRFDESWSFNLDMHDEALYEIFRVYVK